MSAEPIVHGIDRVTQNHLCGIGPGLGTDAQNPAMEITCPLCRDVMDSRPTPKLDDVDEMAAVLRAHAWGDDTAQIGHDAVQCCCGWKAYETGSIYTLRARHDLHRAEALAAYFAGQAAYVKAAGLREAAIDIETDWAPTWGGDSMWMTTGTKVAELVAGTLRAMASEIES